MESNKHLLDVAQAYVQSLHLEFTQARDLYFNSDRSKPYDQDEYQQYWDARIAYQAADRMYRELLAAEDERLAAAGA